MPLFAFARILPRVPLAALLALTACGARSDGFPRFSSTGDDPLASSPWRPPSTYQQCETTPAEVSNVDALLDSAALVRRITAREFGRGHVLLTFSFDGNGMPADARTLESTVSTAAAEALLGDARAAMRPQSGAAWARLRVDVAGDEGGGVRYRMRIGGTQYCPATLANENEVRRALGALRLQGSVHVILYVDQEGMVQEHELVSGSGRQTTDDIALGMVTGLRYSPAYLERLPVPTRILYEVRF